MLRDLPWRIKKLRREGGYSQEQIARELGMSRPTYMQVETGKRELTVGEAKKLASVFGLSLENFLKNKDTGIKVKLEKGEESTEKRVEPEIRISVPQQNIKKFKEILLYILEKVGARPQIGETAIYKLLYFIDFDYYEKYEEQLIGARYIKNHYGPTPVEFKEIVREMEDRGEVERIKSKYFQYEQKKYLPRRSPNLTAFSAREIALVDEVLNRLGGKNAKELSEYSHGDVPWKSHKEGEIIDYESVFYRDNAYSVREYQDEL